MAPLFLVVPNFSSLSRIRPVSHSGGYRMSTLGKFSTSDVGVLLVRIPSPLEKAET